MGKAKSITISHDEARVYDQLNEWADRGEPLRFLFAVLRSWPVAGDPDWQKWLVPSQSRAGEFHVVDIELRAAGASSIIAATWPLQITRRGFAGR